MMAILPLSGGLFTISTFDMETFWPEVLTFCQSATTAIATELVAQCAKIPAQSKADGSLVTAADQWSDQELRQRIKAQFPDHGVLTEETTHIFPDTDWCWIIDPIDGTTNFTRGIPIWGISLGLLYKGTPVFGFLHFPLLQQSFWGYWLADSGLTGPTGAFLNGEPIRVSDAGPSQNHLFNLCARSSAILKNPFPCKLRLIGVSSYNIALVALGAALGGTEKTPKIWDIAGAWPILLAAGGSFLCLRPEPLFPLTPGQDYGDRPYPCITASSKDLLEQFKALVLAAQ